MLGSPDNTTSPALPRLLNWYQGAMWIPQQLTDKILAPCPAVRKKMASSNFANPLIIFSRAKPIAEQGSDG